MSTAIIYNSSITYLQQLHKVAVLPTVAVTSSSNYLQQELHTGAVPMATMPMVMPVAMMTIASIHTVITNSSDIIMAATLLIAGFTYSNSYI